MISPSTSCLSTTISPSKCGNPPFPLNTIGKTVSGVCLLYLMWNLAFSNLALSMRNEESKPI